MSINGIQGMVGRAVLCPPHEGSAALSSLPMADGGQPRLVGSLTLDDRHTARRSCDYSPDNHSPDFSPGYQSAIRHPQSSYGSTESPPAVQGNPQSAIRNPQFPPLRHCRALTVLEMLVSTTCLVFIVLGLTAMFVETQRAFKAGVKQNTMADAGQTIIDMVSADLSQASDAQNPFITNLCWGWTANASSNYQDYPANIFRINQLQQIFVLVHTNTQWLGVGYAVSNYAGTGAGTLYSYLDATNDPIPNNCLCSNFLLRAQTFPNNYFHRVSDGVVHFNLRAFDQYGNETAWEQGLDFDPAGGSFFYPTTSAYSNSLGVLMPRAGLPAAVQLEVGILEPEAYEQLRALPAGSASQRNFLSAAGGKIQIYRQNIPIAGAIR